MGSVALSEEQQLLLSKLWPRYFPNEQLGPTNGARKDGRVTIVEHFLTFFLDTRHQQRYLRMEGWVRDGPVQFDVLDLAAAVAFPDFLTFVIEKPREVGGCLGLSLSLLAVEVLPSSQGGGITFDQPWAMKACFANLGTESPYENINSASVGRLLALRGHVVRVSPPRPLVTAGAFCCARCSQDTWHEVRICVCICVCVSLLLFKHTNQLTPAQHAHTVRRWGIHFPCVLWHRRLPQPHS
jgi:hypothetical protein